MVELDFSNLIFLNSSTDQQGAWTLPSKHFSSSYFFLFFPGSHKQCGLFVFRKSLKMTKMLMKILGLFWQVWQNGFGFWSKINILGGFFPEIVIRFSSLQIYRKIKFQKTILSLKFKFQVHDSFLEYRISSYSFRGNYSFLTFALCTVTFDLST